jgi:hypothetical protein
MTKSLKQKLLSRKFQVWIAFLVFAILAFFKPDIDTSTRNIVFQGFSTVSIIYILGNAATAYIYNRKIPDNRNNDGN